VEDALFFHFCPAALIARHSSSTALSTQFSDNQLRLAENFPLWSINENR